MCLFILIFLYPSKIFLPLSSLIISSTSLFETGHMRIEKSLKISAKIPPSPRTIICPKVSSCFTPTISSIPSIDSCTRTFLQFLILISFLNAFKASSLLLASITAFNSVLCVICLPVALR